MRLDDKADTNVTIQGVARNAKAGASVLIDDHTSVYVAGLDRWDGAMEGKRVSVTGTLRKRGGDNVVNAKGEYSAGIPGDRLVLEHPTWKVA